MTWPWPGDTREDKAKRVALSAIHLADRLAHQQILDPVAAIERFHQEWQSLGVGWTRPTNSPLDLDDWQPAPVVADLLGRTTWDIYNWAARHSHQIRTGTRSDGVAIFNVGDVAKFIAEGWRKRAGVARPDDGPVS